MAEGQQPALHDLTTVLRAPDVAISAPDGQIHATGAHGLYRHDRRILALLEAGVEEAELVPTGARATGAEQVVFQGTVRKHTDRTLDPMLRYVRERQVGEETDRGRDKGQGQCQHRGPRRDLDADDRPVEVLRESWTVHNATEAPAELAFFVTSAGDFAAMDAVKSGAPAALVPPDAGREGARWTLGGTTVRLVPERAADEVTAADGVVRWVWRVTVPARGSWQLRLTATQYEDSSHRSPEEPVPFLPPRPVRPLALTPPASVTAAGGDAVRLLGRGLEDLDGLLLADPDSTDDSFLAAGSPWFFTLFGRDSIWAARFLLPLSTELAGGTLRVLAARQGTRYDARTEEQPGRIPHEIRRAPVDIDDPDKSKRLYVPPLYYGTIDATPLWVCLLRDAWRAGLPDAEVAELLPTLRAALKWQTGPGDPDGDGFCEYQGSEGNGLSNQGWKDSGDGIRWADGTIARRPLALCEVQGYAHEAALAGAELLDAFAGKETGEGERWRSWAAELRDRFREAFWVTDEHGTYPVIALDGDKRAVTGPSSNMAHLLGTGLLNEEESALVAEHLAGPALNSGYGLRTLSSRTDGYNPLSYHCGSVWPHDTAIAVLGLASEGHHKQARALAEGLLRAGVAFGYRMPELFGGTDHAAGEPVLAYPASCRPQAWSAAGGVAVAGYLAGWPSVPLARD
ncbi:MAG TPA: amylo-alpha-1,6-glucosidase [Streptomyces sp.]|nr:amylo-alpha-1,6-glucosidase [Streptomyces sp.]